MDDRVPFDVMAKAAEVLFFGLLASFFVFLVLGYRPVILVSGSMAPAAPEGSLIIVADVSADDVAVDDIIVMKRDNDKLITHRIIDISEADGRRFVTTKGDANPTPDPIRYEIDGSQRIVSVVIPVLGSLLLPIAGSFVLGLIALASIVAIGINSARRSFKSELDRPMGHLLETVGSQSANGVDA